jgi:uncharacterized alkaline shock family protein YloU/adenylate kinase family enzyme
LKIIGFVGPSGTGKSHRAIWVAKERGIDHIIDDGLLIKDNQVVAGMSAKRESTKISSIRRALFLDETQRTDMINVIKKAKPKGILILGTSDQMVERIASQLELPSISEKVYITDVASEFEIEQAINTRKEQGKHVIPVPTFEIKKDFPGYFLDPLQIFKRKGKGNYQLVGEKSVVRPTFSYLGSYTISDYTLYQLVEYSMKDMDGVHKITRFRAETQDEGTYIEMDLILNYGHSIKGIIHEIQTKVREEIEKQTALNIHKMFITVKSLHYDK